MLLFAHLDLLGELLQGTTNLRDVFAERFCRANTVELRSGKTLYPRVEARHLGLSRLNLALSCFDLREFRTNIDDGPAGLVISEELGLGGTDARGREKCTHETNRKAVMDRYERGACVIHGRLGNGRRLAC